MRQDNLLHFLQLKLLKLKTKSQLGGEKLSSVYLELEGKRTGKMDDFKYTSDQVAEIYAKLEVAKMLIKLGTDMAEQATTDIQFYRMTNDDTK
jgi:hypothetical protein